MLLIFFLSVRYVFAGTPHAVYGVPPVGSNIAYLQRPTSPVTSLSPANHRVNPSYQQPSRQRGNGDYRTQARPTSYWGGSYNNPSAHQGGKLISAASATYRPYSGNLSPSYQSRETYLTYSAVNNRVSTYNPYQTQRNDANNYRGDSYNSRYQDFLSRYYDWYQNVYKKTLTGAGYYSPPYPDPVDEKDYKPLEEHSPAPWWLSGGFSGPVPAASSSSGGPVGPFVETPAKLMTGQPGAPNKAIGVSPEFRINEDESFVPNSKSTSLGKLNPDSGDSTEPYSMSKGNSGSVLSSSNPMTTPETTSSPEGSSPSSEESSLPTPEESSTSPSEETSPPSEESSSPSSEEISSPSSEESSSPSSEEISSSPSEESSSPSSEESSSPSSEESSSPSSEESSSQSSMEMSSSTTEEGSSQSSMEISSSTTEESSSQSSMENSSSTTEETSSTDAITESSDTSETNTIDT